MRNQSLIWNLKAHSMIVIQKKQNNNINSIPNWSIVELLKME